MRSISIKTLFFVGLLSLLSCSNEEDRLKRQTKIFENYLITEFNTKPGDREEYYFIIPSMACAGCEQAVIRYIQRAQKEDNIFLIISGNQAKTLQDFDLQHNVFIDTENKIDRLNLDALNTTLLIWDKKKIRSIKYINPQNIDSLSPKLN
jgi:hypothetical protein